MCRPAGLTCHPGRYAADTIAAMRQKTGGTRAT
jgi:hypothetical protein